MDDLLGMPGVPATPAPAAAALPETTPSAAYTPVVAVAGGSTPSVLSKQKQNFLSAAADDDAANVFDNLRWLITIIDKLRDIGLHRYISLPRICAIGGQSAGKSSVVESICGLDFLPRGEGTVTRRPLDLRLVHVPADSAERRPYAVFEVEPERKYFDFATEVKAKIEAETDRVAGVNRGIVDIPIVMTLYSKDVMDLTIIDLPGITRVPVAGTDQSDNIEQVTRDLTMKYISDANTLILACIPGNIDLSVSDALQLARRVDPEGHRTVGVVSKLDIMDKGCDATKILRNEEIHLALGYVGVKLRSQAEIRAGVPVTQAIENERAFFQSHKQYSKMPPSLLGIPSLGKTLNSQLERVIAASLPETIREIAAQRHKLTQRLADLGKGVPAEDAGKREMAYRMVSHFCAVLDNSIRGRFERHLHSYMGGINADQASGGSRLRSVFNGLYDEDFYGRVTRISDEEVHRAIKKHEGDSLPGFPSPDTFEYLVQPRLKALQMPAQECVARVASCLDSLAVQFGEAVFRQFPAMGSVMVTKTHELCLEMKEICGEHVQNVIEAEVGYIFTNDENYLGSHSHMLSTSGSQQQQQQQHGEQGVDPVTGLPATHPPAVPGGLDNGLTMSTNQARTAAFSQPLVADLRARLDSYFSVVLKNVSDSVPRMVGHFLIRALQERLSFVLHTALQQQTSSNLCTLLGEPVHVTAERDKLSAQMKVLKESENALANEPSLAMARLDVGAGVRGVGI